MQDAESDGMVKEFTDIGVNKLRSTYEANKEDAIGFLISQVLTVNPSAHRNINNVY